MKIIVVDDDKICSTIFKLEMSKYGQCDIVNNGPNAIKAYKESLETGFPYKLMLLDIIMPDMDGGEALRQIRQIEKDNNIPDIDKLRIIITTAFDDWYNRNIIINNLDYAYENYFIKSPDLSALKEKILDFGFVLD